MIQTRHRDGATAITIITTLPTGEARRIKPQTITPTIPHPATTIQMATRLGATTRTTSLITTAPLGETILITIRARRIIARMEILMLGVNPKLQLHGVICLPLRVLRPTETAAIITLAIPGAAEMTTIMRTANGPAQAIPGAEGTAMVIQVAAGAIRERLMEMEMKPARITTTAAAGECGFHLQSGWRDAFMINAN